MSQSDFYVPDLGRWCFILQFHMQSKGALERRFKAEKSDDCVQVAFGQVNSSTARSFPTRRSSSSVKQEQEVNLFSKYMMSGVTTSAAKLPKQFTGPQDFTHPSYNYPPITLPLRRPHSADPEDFDEDEFGEFSSSRTQDGELTAAKELGLMKTMPHVDGAVFFFVVGCRWNWH
uniref:Uncharacterized protein n=1 Tax=Aegilops tauschii subsp. strangulata TaxID=200361 RepID=A0A453HD55_AEGTS